MFLLLKMNSIGSFESDICKLSFNSKRDYLKHNSSDHHLNGATEEYEQEFDFVAKVECRGSVKVEYHTTGKTITKTKAEAEVNTKDKNITKIEANAKTENKVILKLKLKPNLKL